MINRCVPAQHWLSVRLQHAQTRMAPWLCHVRTHHASTLVSSGACTRRFAWQADSLLDFACGRGGDLQKWFDAGVRSAPQPLQQSTSVPRRLPALRPRPTRRRSSTSRASTCRRGRSRRRSGALRASVRCCAGKVLASRPAWPLQQVPRGRAAEAVLENFTSKGRGWRCEGHAAEVVDREKGLHSHVQMYAVKEGRAPQAQGPVLRSIRYFLTLPSAGQVRRCTRSLSPRPRSARPCGARSASLTPSPACSRCTTSSSASRRCACSWPTSPAT